MNKRIKLISSVALAGVLAINVCNPKTLATTIDDYGSKLKGTHNGMAQFVLEDITDSAIINGKTIKTGETIDINGTSYTAIVYGDANSDGRVNANDAAYVLKSLTGYEGVTLNDAQKEAANVYRIGSANVNASNARDAVNILKFCTGSQLTEGVTFDEEEPVEEDTNFSIELSDGSAYFNNTNTTNPTFKIKVATPVNKTNLTIKVEGKKADGTDITPITSSASSMTTSLNDISMSINGNLSSVVGNVKVTLLEGTKVLRIAKIENKTADIDLANIKTNRLNSTEATISFEGMGKYDVKNVYYTIAQGTTNTTNPTIESEKIVVIGNKVTNEALKGLNAAGAHDKYTVNMLVEDIYGNLSSANGTPKYATATVLKEEAQANQKEKVNITLDKAITSTVHFDVKKLDGTTNNDQNIKYVLYKDGKIIKEASAPAQEKIEINSLDLDGVGTYKISVIVVGDGNTTSDSEATEATFEVKALNSVSNITIAEDKVNGKLAINWNKSSEENVSGYTIGIFPIILDTNGNAVISSTKTQQITPNKNDESDNSINISSLTKDTAYVAKIVANSNSILFEASEEKISNQIVILGASTLSLGTVTTTSNSITFTPSGMKTVPGVTPNYTLKVYNDNGANLGLATRYTLLKEINNPIGKDGKIVVDGLQAGKAYGFDLIETIGNAENITSTISGSILSVSTKTQAPVVNGLTVVKSTTPISVNNASEYVGKIAVDTTNNVFINGVVYNKSTGDYSRDVAKIVDVLAGLYDGDKITINEDIVTLDLVNATETRNFGTALNGKTVIVNCDTKVEKDLTMATPTKVTLQGNGALYDVKGIGTRAVIEIDKNVANIKANDTQALELLQNASTTINGVNVSTKVGTKVAIDNSTKAVTVHVDASKTDSELSFENNGNITFKTIDTTNKTTLAGTVKINTTKAVTIATTGVAVDASINVISAAAVTAETSKDIDLTAPRGLNGTKSVTVNKDAKSKVKFYSKTDAPKAANGTQKVTVSGKTVTLRQDYVVNATRDDIAELEIAGLITDRTDAVEVKAVTDYLKSFGINDANAKLTLEANNKVTITFTNGATQTVTIGNIK